MKKEDFEKRVNEINEGEKKKSLKYSIGDASAHSAMVGFGENYITPFAIALKATTPQIGFLASVPRLAGSIFQAYAAELTDRLKKRKLIINTAVFLQAIIWLPILLIPFVIPKYNIWLLTILVALYWTFGQAASPAWSSLMGDLVDDKNRGSYFGKRNKAAGYIELTSIFAAGIILNYFSKFNVFTGFVVLFSVAMAARLISLYYLNKMYEPPYIIKREDYFSFRQYVKRLPTTNYGSFVLYFCLLTFGTQVAAPFFAVFMLRDLQFSYMTYMIIIAAASISTLMSMVYWGRNIDQFGNKNVLTVCGFLVAVIPLLWLVSGSLYYLVFVQIYAGFFWAGFNLAAFNMLFDTVKPSKRSRCVAYQNILVGFSIFFGAILGGFLTKVIPTPGFFISNIEVLFIISAVLRFLPSLILLPKIKETKPVTDVETKNLFLNLAAIKPIKGLRYQAMGSATNTIKIFKKGIKATKELEEMGVEATKKLRKRKKKNNFKF